MRENELEEGELEEGEVSALLFQYERNFDPDIDLSHIGEKVQLLLGHFQKDFENGALTESLGSTHGGYGSFLPSYEQSPHHIPPARTTQIRQNNYIARYRYYSSLQRINQDSTPTPSATLTENYAHTTLLPINSGTTMNNTSRANVYLPSYKGPGDFAMKPMTVDRWDNPTQHNSTLSEKYEQVNREVALDSLPSSLEEIQAKTSALPLEIQEEPNESTMSTCENVSSFPDPEECLLTQISDNFVCSSETLTGNNLISNDSAMSIAECMTSFPVPENCLLSPLPDNLLQLKEKPEKGNCESMASDDGSQAEKQMLEDSPADKTRGDRRASFSEDTQLERREQGRTKARNRSGMEQCDISEEEALKSLHKFGQLRRPECQNDLDCHPKAPTSGPALSDDHPLALLHQDHNMVNQDLENEKEYGSYLPAPDLENTLNSQPDANALGPTSYDEQHLAQFCQEPSLVNLPNLEYQTEHDSAADDAKQSGSCFKRLADEERSRMSKRTKSASLYHANENCCDENSGVRGGLGSNSGNTLLTGKDTQIHRANSSSKDSKSFHKTNSDLSKKHIDRSDDSLDGGNMDSENSKNKNASNENKMDSQETQGSSSQSCSSSFPNLGFGEETNENEVSTEKRTRVGEFTSEKGNKNIVWQSTAEIHADIGQTVFPADASGYEQTVPKVQNNRSLKKDFAARSTIMKNSSSQCAASEVIKEGNNIREKAVYQKNFCSTLETTGLYFEAALKFLQGAVLLKPCSEEIAKLRAVTDSMFMYREAATLFESSAKEYDKYNKMAAAALAYKCMEVALMRVIYEKRNRVNQEREELQKELRNAWLGNSPGFSGSDIENPYTDGTRMARSHNIVVGSRPKFERMLNLTGDVMKALEAGRNSQNALEACMNDEQEQDPNDADIVLVKKAIDYSFSCVEEVLSLAEDALESLPDYGGYKLSYT